MGLESEVGELKALLGALADVQASVKTLAPAESIKFLSFSKHTPQQ
jgi:hypothetical protein